MSIFDQKCEYCGARMDRNAKFCPSCGQPTGHGKVRCGYCGAEMSPAAQFCGHCGKPVGETARPAMFDSHWVRGADDFATRVDVHDLEGVLRKEIVVEAGTQAILLADGRVEAGRVGPGRYTIENLIGRFFSLGGAKSMVAILIEGGDIVLDFAIENLYTKDPIKVMMECSLVVQLANPVLFLTTVLKGSNRFTRTQLRDYLFDELQNAAEEAVSGHTIEELGSRLELKREFEVDILAHLNRTFERAGLRFDRVRTLNYRCQVWDRKRQALDEYAILATEQEAKEQKRELLFRGEMDERVHELVKQAAEVALFEKRAEVLERMRRATLSDKMNEVQTAEDWAAFMQTVNRDRVIRDHEMEALKKEYAERMEDRDAARAHLVARLKMERDFELERLKLTNQFGLDEERLKLETDLARKKLAAFIELDERELTYQLEKRRRQVETDIATRKLQELEQRERELAEAQKNAQIALTNAKTAAEIAALEREQDRLDGEMGILLLEKMKAVRRRDDEERLRIELEAEERRLQMELARKRQEIELAMKAEAERARMELERLEKLSHMSAEALIAVSGPEQAGLLAQLKRTEALRGFSEEQILAMAAERSPAVAEAFKEKFRALGSIESQKQLEALYQRMLDEQRACAVETRQMAEEHARRLQEMFNKALDSQRETATAFAGRSSEPTIVVTPGGQAGYVRMGGAGATPEGGEVVVCRRCGRKSPAGARFCENCGYEFWSSEGK